MSLKHISTADHLLGSSTRARLLRILLFQRCPRAWLRDISRRTSTGVEAVRRELDLLTSVGLIRMSREGGAAFFEAVDDHPMIEPLRQLIAYADDYDSHGLWRHVWPWQRSGRAGTRAIMTREPTEPPSESGALMDARQAYDAVTAVIGPVYMVGGSVRDALMGRTCADYDFATPLDPDTIENRVRAMGKRPYLVGKKFGTVGFKIGPGEIAEVTSFRAESYAEGNRKPRVEFLGELEEDLARRDFTMNAMALHDGEVIDPFDGQADIMAGVIRAVGDPRERFREDPLRMLRAARFVSQIGFRVEPQTAAAMTRYAHRILLVARERWVLELDKLLVGPAVVPALRLLAETDLLRYLLPELQLQVGYDQGSPYHDRTLFEHTLGVVAAAPADVTLRWAALLHDVGKPYMRAEKPGRSTYVKHDLLGAEIVERTALYLKWGNRRREDVRRLVLEHMLADSPLRDADDSAKAARDEVGRPAAP